MLTDRILSMNDQPNPEISTEFSDGYPYLAKEYARQDAHDTSQAFSYAEAMRIIGYANMPHVKVVPSRMGGDTFLDI